MAWLLLFLAFPFALEAQDKTNSKGWSIEQTKDRLVFTFGGEPAGEFVFRDESIRRPYFANLRTASGLKVTRNHPPLKNMDETDHGTMHPGLWLAFGDISGNDFWRNQGTIEHMRFTEQPKAEKEDIRFATESRLMTAEGKELCPMTNRFLLRNGPLGRLLIWEAIFNADEGEFTFGDQEEMGFGARVATPFTEKNGGRIVNSHGQETAAKTWGQKALWCDYSGTANGKPVGITLMPAPTNFRESWWHNRDYGLFVANPFGREAMKQGAKSEVAVRRGEAFRVGFAALWHDAQDYQPEAAYREFLTEWKTWAANE
jgi:hypothetical protein